MSPYLTRNSRWETQYLVAYNYKTGSKVPGFDSVCALGVQSDNPKSAGEERRRDPESPRVEKGNFDSTWAISIQLGQFRFYLGNLDSTWAISFQLGQSRFDLGNLDSTKFPNPFFLLCSCQHLVRKRSNCSWEHAKEAEREVDGGV